MKLNVTRDSVSMQKYEYVNTGEVNSRNIYFNFSDEYKNTINYAVFKREQENYIAKVENDYVTVPIEACKHAGKMKIGVYGYTEDEQGNVTLRYSPKPCDAIVREGSYEDGKESTTIVAESDFEQQIRKYNENAEQQKAKLEEETTKNIEKINNVKSEQDNKIAQIEQSNNSLIEKVSQIQNIIPNQANTENQLADKDFVNSSIATNTATFKGTFNTLTELKETNADVNDYGNVITIEEGQTYYNRYTYDGEKWVFNFKINNTTFTAEQWKALNSKATEDLISQISTNKENVEKIETEQEKQNKDIESNKTAIEKATQKLNKALLIYDNFATANASKMSETLVGNTTQATTTGKNMLNLQLMSDDEENVKIAGLTFTHDASSINLTGTTNGTWGAINFKNILKLEAGKTYTFSAIFSGTVPNLIITLRQYDDDNGKTIFNKSVVNGKSSITFTYDETEGKPTRTIFVMEAIQINTTYDCHVDLMLEEGDTATDYEPYTGGIPSPNPDYPQEIKNVTGDKIVSISDGTDSIDYPLSLADMELCKIEDYKDYIYYKDGKWWKHHIIGKERINSDNTTEFRQIKDGYRAILYSSLYNKFRIIDEKDLINVKSNYFEGITRNESDSAKRFGIAAWNTDGYMCSYSDTLGLDTIDKFKEWLNNNNVIAYFIIATPTEEEITDTTLISQLNNILDKCISLNIEGKDFTLSLK